jgi:hypothetical protein
MPAYPRYMHIQKRSSVFSYCLSFECVWLPTSGPLCHACFLRRVDVIRISNFVCLSYGLDMFFISDTEIRPICPTYLNGHSLYFKWHTPPNLYMYTAFPLNFWCFYCVGRSVLFYVSILKLFSCYLGVCVVTLEGNQFCFVSCALLVEKLYFCFECFISCC